jgi:hypothetical protein
MNILKVGLVASAAAAALFIAPAANAQHRHGHGHGHHHHHHHHGGWIGPGIVGGLALGAIATQQSYAYGPRCWTERQIVVDRRGREFVRPVRVCD